MTYGLTEHLVSNYGPQFTSADFEGHEHTFTELAHFLLTSPSTPSMIMGVTPGELFLKHTLRSPASSSETFSGGSFGQEASCTEAAP